MVKEATGIMQTMVILDEMRADFCGVHFRQGLEKFPEALLMLFEGKNFGKLILQVGEDD